MPTTQNVETAEDSFEFDEASRTFYDGVLTVKDVSSRYAYRTFLNVVSGGVIGEATSVRILAVPGYSRPFVTVVYQTLMNVHSAAKDSIETSNGCSTLLKLPVGSSGERDGI